VRAGRKTPYKARGISRLQCARCGEPARFQWSACADGNLYRPLCGKCDVGLNLAALTYMRDPDAEAKVATYAKSKGIEA
jgi:hypothetical protein